VVVKVIRQKACNTCRRFLPIKAFGFVGKRLKSGEQRYWRRGTCQACVTRQSNELERKRARLQWPNANQGSTG
jgi:hypothetical protein